MATPPNGLDITQQSQTVAPQPPQETTAEPSVSNPQKGRGDEPQNSGDLTKDDQDKLIALVRMYKDQGSQNRLILMQRCLENLEFFKGNQYLSFGPGSASFSSGMDWIGSVSNGNQNSQDSDDKDLYQYCNNFYQMLAVTFVAVLSPELPKSKWMPEDADVPEDVTTAKVAQTIIDVIQQKNRASALLKKQLLYLFTTGSAFRHTRYLVDADRWGTKPEPIFNVTETEIMPARMHCFNCGADNPAQTSQCASCQRPMGGDSFYPAVNGPVVRKVGTQDVPNGMVAQDIYCPLEVDVSPRAKNLSETPFLNLEVEVDLAALRTSYPDMWDEIQSSPSSVLSTNGSIDRIARQQVYSQTEADTNILTDQQPTLSRTWIQPWAFALMDDKDFALRMQAQFPSGVLLVNTGPLFLSAREASLTKEWTWAGTQEAFGLYPPSIGDIVVPFQKKYNDMANILHEGVDRGFSGMTLANVDLIDTKAMQGKPMLPGVLNPVKLKKAGAPGALKLQDALWQFQIEQKIAEALQYMDKLAYNAQMFAGIPPQLYGGAGDPAIETKGGQQQQLNQATVKVNLYWDNIKEEGAQADELAVNCAKDNLTGDMKKVIADKGAEFRNETVRLDDLQGSLHAYADKDQGLPITAEELRQYWKDMIAAATEQNAVALAILDEPANQQAAAMATGIPNLVIPGAAMRNKTLDIIAKLIAPGAQAVPQTDPNTGQQTGLQPSIMPDKDIDDFTVLKQVVREYCQENYDLPNDNPAGWQNLLAYFTAATALETAQKVQDAQQQGKAIQAHNMAAAPPPKPPPQLSPQEQNMLNQVRADGAEAMQDLLKISSTPPLQQGQSLQAQTSAANALMQLAAKVEQIATDKTTVQ